MKTTGWMEQAAYHKSQLEAAIPGAWKLSSAAQADLPLNVSNLVRDCGQLDAVELEIISLDATDLAQAIAKRSYTAVIVTTAYAKAAAIAHQATNCLSDYFPEEALERARWLDQELERTGNPVGPLHGVPISVKDQIGLKGHLASCGFLSAITETKNDSLLVSIFRSAGAVFMAKSCLPQAIMHLETDSFRGPTLNPYNRNLTPGGSSGGESALLGCKGSAMGIGSDIGGSIRNPCALTGLYGFKPTVGRVPTKGGDGTAIYGQDTIYGTTGPMCRSSRDLELWLRTIITAEPWKRHPTVLKMPWNMGEVSYLNGGARPKIGILWDDGVVRPQPPIRRAIQYAVDKLKRAGFELVDVKPYKSEEAWNIISSLYFTDGGQINRNYAARTGEPLLPLTEWILSQNTKARSATDIMALNLKRDLFRADYHNYFHSLGVDVILCPATPGPAPKLGTSKYWNYTSFWNLVDYPCGVFPTGLKVEFSDLPDAPYKFTGKADEEVWKAYDSPGSFIDAPLGLQVVGAKYEEELTLQAMGIIAEVVQGN
ncbi:hypothetical protein I317_00529 [Kwoniella heveanensis CBS 569]|uniref:amidase n=1 Tax=Kwoniella heveanensis BCC8398 TaxID=1296120 RepID=A0A1B9GY97_9TREE|nr:hypothetical protein I316_02502 [Kwoniella heveanensis BCC8398]OCF45627.1 hypothetical protein I317_00529 [Kwoniella heveanensis CBS 569]